MDRGAYWRAVAWFVPSPGALRGRSGSRPAPGRLLPIPPGACAGGRGPLPCAPMRLILARIVAALVATALTLALAEALLGLVYPSPGSSQDYRVPDAELGWRLQPGASYTNETGEFSVRVDVNADGWRDRTHTEAKPAGVKRVVVLGDSFMEGYSVAGDELFASRLGEDTGAEVINLGVGGYGTLQAYRAFALHGVRYAPDVVALGFFTGNDVRNNSRDLERAMWKSGGHVKVRNRPFLEPGAAGEWKVREMDYADAAKRHSAWAARKAAESAATRWVDRLALKRALARAWDSVSDWVDRADIDGEGAEGKGAAATSTRGRPNLAWQGAELCEEHPQYTAAWDLTERILERLRREVAASGATLVVFSVPPWELVDPAQRAAVEQKLAHPERYCLEEAPAHRRLAGILERLGVPYVELLPAFRRASREEGIPLFRTSDLHWNPAGHALAAREVAKAIAPLLRASASGPAD